MQPLEVSIAKLEELDSWKTEDIEKVLSAALIDDLQLKPRKAYGALRVAISGQQVSPPLFESMELLGKESTLARLKAALAVTPWSAE